MKSVLLEKNKSMKKFICSLFFIVSIINVNGQKSVYGFVDLKPVYKYTDSYNWDIFEVTSYGSGSIETLSDNAKSKLLIELFENGFSGKKLIKPLGLNLNNNNYVEQIEEIRLLLLTVLSKIVELSKWNINFFIDSLWNRSVFEV
jgi:hypothetical protein